MSPSFRALGVPEPLVAALARRGVTEPFPIQAATLPDALAGRDVAGRAPTGSGKTLAFGLAIATRVAARTAPARPRRPRALVLVPTRELAAQVQRELQALTEAVGGGPVATVYGGVGYGPQRRLLARGVEAMVACPGRLEDLVSTGDAVLDQVELVVLDEADRMADMGFLPAVRRLVDRTPDRRQTLLFSATLDGEVDALVARYQRDPARHAVEPEPADAVEVPHLFWRVARAERVQVAADVIARCGPTIVFCRTRHGADRAARQLTRVGVKAVAIHGGRTQGQRDRALAAFTRGRAAALVATDVAARGIHVDGVAAVLHLDLPADPKDYVHRSGRTGRAGATGVVVGLVPAEEGAAGTRALLRQIGRTDPVGEVRLAALDLVAAGQAEPVGPAAASSVPAVSSAASAVSPVASAAPAPAAGGPAPAGGSGYARGSAAPAPAGDPEPAARPVRRKSRASTRHERPAAGPSAGTERGEPGGRRGSRAETGSVRGERGGPGSRRGARSDAGAPAGGERRPRRRPRDGAGTGTVIRFHRRKGYGFIDRGQGAELFVHVSELAPTAGPRALRPGQRVRFDVAAGPRGPQAVNVRPVPAGRSS